MILLKVFGSCQVSAQNSPVAASHFSQDKTQTFPVAYVAPAARAAFCHALFITPLLPR